jgi:iron complex transport system ATP-binding protein
MEKIKEMRDERLGMRDCEQIIPNTQSIISHPQSLIHNPSISLRNVAVGYGKKVVMSGITADIYQGELTCIIGDNGVGKSTLLRTLAGFQPCLQGEISFFGHSIDTFSRHRLARMIGVVLTERPDVENLTVEEIVSLGRTPYTGFWGLLSKEDHKVVHEALHTVGIDGMAGRMIHTLSDGERQKVMIAKALAQQTQIIFLDEPTAFLDFTSKVETLRLLGTLSRDMGKTVLLSTHDVEIVLQIADRLWIIEDKPSTSNVQSSTSNVQRPTFNVQRSILVGSPRELADKGIISQFVERDGITFDEKTLGIKVDK